MFTLSDCITRINQILNYPSVTYTDISHFFDQAISELNTTFKIGLPLVSDMISENKFNVSEIPNVTLLNDIPTGSTAEISAVADSSAFTDTSKIYYKTTDGQFYKYNSVNDSWVGYNEVYGVYVSASGRALYQTVPMYGTALAFWSIVDEKRLNDFDLTIYLPEDWIILFLIPYVCFKTAVRDGSDGGLYSDEFTQGFQQLQTSYDVPNFVELSKVAHLPAYTSIVKNNIAALNIKVPTRAVLNSMKTGNAIMPEYGGFNSRGGWGI